MRYCNASQTTPGNSNWMCICRKRDKHVGPHECLMGHKWRNRRSGTRKTGRKGE